VKGSQPKLATQSGGEGSPNEGFFNRKGVKSKNRQGDGDDIAGKHQCSSGDRGEKTNRQWQKSWRAGAVRKRYQEITNAKGDGGGSA